MKHQPLYRIAFLCFALAMPIASLAGALEDGHTAFDAQRYEDALRLWQPLAEQGDPDAQYNLGLLYMNGLGVEKDERTALLWFTRAGQQGLADAQYNAGVMFYAGKGVYPSQKTAVEWWKLAAGHGHANAQNNLAAMYAFGYGVGQDRGKALALWTAAAEQGHQDAIDTLINVYSGKLEGFTQDPAKAAYWSGFKR